ncbi:apical endosomal glycoprotein-like [Mytilus californianus]|uniref:apical endosomal glycoprotein-like n=1 Tax=Mytilus californianus TaxID=6549 RepID=UPI002247010D|nr:apical endosomal glycoprotein-like [Mytilus californianus]
MRLGNPTFVNSLKYCYACSSGRPTSDDCNQITACAQDQLCQIKEIFNLFKEARWITGCAEKQQCDAISQQVHNECSNRCCGQNLCNAGCNNTTIPTVSANQLVSKLSCTFDGKNTCFWASESNHQKGITQWEFDSSNKTLTGLPTQDHTTGQGIFLFAKMDSHHSGYISLTSPTFQPNVSYCLSLWYSTTDQNIMKLFVLDVKSRHRHVYRLVAQVGNEWKKFQTTLHQTYSFKIRIEAHIIAHSNRQQSPASIDDIKVLGGPCN